MDYKGLVFITICILVSHAQVNGGDPNTLSSDPASTTSTSPPPISTSLKPTTSTSTTSTSTTSTSTTPTSTTSTSSPKPTPITTPSPPKPDPKPETGKWAYSNSTTNKTCIIVQMALQFNITYQTQENSTSEALLNLPKNLTQVINGSCGDAVQTITLGWNSTANQTSMLQFTFNKNDTSNKFALSKVEAWIQPDPLNFPNIFDNKTLNLVHNDTIFNAPLTMSYRCGRVQNFTLNGNTSHVFISDVQMQAFHAEKGTLFGSAVDCDYVDVPDIVPIAVGCALGALVLIVLIAYLVGRRRNRARGYLSM